MSLKFSVVTPSYNQGEFIERTIQSVLVQNVSFEYLICDGGSQDTTCETLKKYGEKLTWLSEPDKGQSDAVNKGIVLSSGDIIAWLNSDDIYYPGALEKVLNIFTYHPEIEVVYGDADWINENDKVLKQFPTEPWRYPRLKQTCFLCQPAVFFKRSLVERYGNLDETLNFCMDYELWLRYGQHVDFFYLPEKLAGSRMYQSNKTMGQSLAAHGEIISMFRAKQKQVPANWLLGYALVKVEKEHGISRFDRTQTTPFVSLLVKLSLIELLKHNKWALLRVAPKMLFWFLLPEKVWFRREAILTLAS